MKKILALALAICMIFTLCACGQKDNRTVLKMWCIATESDANRPGYEKAIAEFEANHPDIKIEWEAFENNSYKTKIQAAISDPDSLPDIFFTWSGAFLGDFVDAGAVYCLDEAYKPFAADLPLCGSSDLQHRDPLRQHGSSGSGRLHRDPPDL